MYLFKKKKVEYLFSFMTYIVFGIYFHLIVLNFLFFNFINWVTLVIFVNFISQSQLKRSIGIDMEIRLLSEKYVSRQHKLNVPKYDIDGKNTFEERNCAQWRTKTTRRNTIRVTVEEYEEEQNEEGKKESVVLHLW